MNISTLFFDNSIFTNFEKQDGIIAFYFYVALGLWMFIVFYFVKLNHHLIMYLPSLIRPEYTFFFLVIDLPSYLAIFLILRSRNQKINTIGFRYEGWKSSFLIGIITITILLKKNVGVDTIIHYYISVGFSEEIAFRGFFWPRLVALLGKYKGTILCGIMFGIVHTPILIVFKGKNPFIVMMSYIGGGIMYQLIYGFIYSINKNIMLPSFVHGFLDSLQGIT